MKNVLLFCVLSCLLDLQGVAQRTTQAPPKLGPVEPVLVSEERFALAFLRHVSENSDAHVEVSLSKEGVDWSDAEFPAPSTFKLNRTSGVGICGSFDGRNLTVVMNDLNSGVNITTGSLAATSVSWSVPRTVLAIPLQWIPQSAPSCAYLLPDTIAVAFNTGKSVILQLYAGGQYFFEPTIPERFNSNAFGSPSLAALHGKILMAWRNQQGQGCLDVVLAQGEIVKQGSQISYFTLRRPEDPQEKSGVLGLTATDVTPCAVSDPVVTADGGHFYVAVVQEQRSTGGLHGWSVVLYKSFGDDLNSGWAEERRIPLGVHNQTYVEVAAKQDSTLLAGKVRDLPQGANDVNAQIYNKVANNWIWRDIGSTPWINGGDASYRPFSLVRFGVNSPRPLDPNDAISRPKIHQ